jgi:hypothetical protein
MREIQYIHSLNVERKVKIYDLADEIVAGLGVLGLLATIVCLFLIGANVIEITDLQEIRYISIAAAASCTLIFVYMVFRNYWGREPFSQTHNPKDVSFCLIASGFIVLIPGIASLGYFPTEPNAGKVLSLVGLIFVTWGMLLFTIGLSRNFMEKRMHEKALTKPTEGMYQKLG